MIDVLAEQGFGPRTVRINLGETLPDPAAFSVVVTLGPSGSTGLGQEFYPEVAPKIVGDCRTGSEESIDARGILGVISREFATASAAGRRLLSTHPLARAASRMSTANERTQHQ